MRPDELKEIARRFTERYYPDHIRRFDRIWKMFEDAPADFIKSSGREGVGDGFGISGGVEEDTKDAITGIAIFAVAYQGIKDKDSVSGEEVWEKMSIVPLDADLSVGLREKFEEILGEMLPSLCREDKNRRKGVMKAEAIESDSKKFYSVFVSKDSGIGSQKFIVSEKELDSRFLSRKEDFDILVYKQNVEIKNEKKAFQSIELYPSILALLILFLKYKNEPLAIFDLYHCAWKDSALYEAEITENNYYNILSTIKTGISSLRKIVKPFKKIIIPNAKRGDKIYTCKGEFQFCLILNEHMDQAYTLQVS